MVPERMEFLNRFNKFYQTLINSVKEDKINEGEFYHFIIAKAEDMNREREERKKNKGGRR